MISRKNTTLFVFLYLKKWVSFYLPKSIRMIQLYSAKPVLCRLCIT